MIFWGNTCGLRKSCWEPLVGVRPLLWDAVKHWQIALIFLLCIQIRYSFKELYWVLFHICLTIKSEVNIHVVDIGINSFIFLLNIMPYTLLVKLLAYHDFRMAGWSVDNLAGPRVDLSSGGACVTLIGGKEKIMQ